MPLAAIAVLVGGCFLLAYRFYGRFVGARYGLDDSRPTPAVRRSDGVDFVPTGRAVLLAQHFASIAAAGPVVGPIVAALAFGWAPSLAWVVLGSIFIGACHDFSSLVASVRHDARSIPEMVRELLGPRAWALVVAFVWLSLLYVIIAFTDITAQQFVKVEDWDGEAHNVGGGVAASSFLFLGLSLLLGICLEKLRMPLWLGTALFVPALFGVIWFGQSIPITMPFDQPVMAWSVVILLYCAAASVIPLWALLQPRGYLGGYFLYITLACGALGMLFGGFEIEYPALREMYSERVGPIYPFLFVTIACGACSGFHGLVCSGTTCKQIARESDAHLVGYGGMLLEGVVAVMALATVMIWPAEAQELRAPPGVVYARGIAHFLHAIAGIPIHWGQTFGMLAFATFVYDTLDVATRLGRYLIEEMLRLRGPRGRLLATALTLGVPLAYLLLAPATLEIGGRQQPTWLAIWTIFGSSNQLLAALTLLLLSAWVARSGGRGWWVRGPAYFMLLTTAIALGWQCVSNFRAAAAAGSFLSVPGVNALLALLLVILAAAFTVEWMRSRSADRTPSKVAPA